MKELDWALLAKEGWHNEYDHVRDVIRDALKYAQQNRYLSRENVAERMTKLGCNVNVNTVNKWTKEDSNGNRFPLEFAEVFAKVTGDPRILAFSACRLGIGVLSKIEMSKYEAWKLRQKAALLTARAEMLERQAQED